MDKTIKATIFILVYNNANELETTINSVFNQSINDEAEVIISDDGSTNYDIEILEKYANYLRGRYKHVTVNVNEENVGTVKHLNKVFKMAKGQYLFSCSSGDRFYSGTTVEETIGFMEKKDLMIVTSKRVDVYDNGKSRVRPGMRVGWWLKRNPKKLLNYMIRKKNVLSGCCTFYKKELFEQYGYHDERFHLVEDYPYYVNLLRKDVTIGWLASPTVYHSIGGVSTGKVHPSIYSDIELLRDDLFEVKDEFDEKTEAFLVECYDKKHLEVK